MFSPDDFANTETVRMLSSIIMMKIDKKPLTNFHKLSIQDKKRFNETMNDYIKNLPDENWKEPFTKEYQTIMNTEILNEKFKPTDYEPLDIDNNIELLE